LKVSSIVHRKDVWEIRNKFFEKFGEQKMDILVNDGTFTDPFKKKAFNEGILL